MANDQQFCLRWNNHQTTLVEIFDKLLSNDSLVDCTLAAEGQYMKAHKVLLSACSPYFELILSQHNDKHPIIILKDVTFRELKALMDYMYRGEVNVSQDQLGALLKVAENLQIKGLSDSGGGGTEPKEKPPEKRPLPPPPPAQQPTPIIPRPGLTIEHRRSNQLDLSQHSPSALDGSPVPRKRKRTRRRSSDDESSLGHTPIESHHDSSSRESSSLSIPPNVASTPLSKSVAVIPEPPPVLDRTDHILPEPAQPIHQDIVHKTEPNTEMLLEPKHEYPDDDMNEDSVEDLTLEDDMNELDQSQAGPSGEGSSSQGFTPWHMATDRSTDEVFMQAQEAVGAQRDSQDGKVEKVWLCEEDLGMTPEGGDSEQFSETADLSVAACGREVSEPDHLDHVGSTPLPEWTTRDGLTPNLSDRSTIRVVQPAVMLGMHTSKEFLDSLKKRKNVGNLNLISKKDFYSNPPMSKNIQFRKIAPKPSLTNDVATEPSSTVDITDGASSTINVADKPTSTNNVAPKRSSIANITAEPTSLNNTARVTVVKPRFTSTSPRVLKCTGKGRPTIYKTNLFKSIKKKNSQPLFTKKVGPTDNTMPSSNTKDGGKNLKSNKKSVDLKSRNLPEERKEGSYSSRLRSSKRKPASTLTTPNPEASTDGTSNIPASTDGTSNIPASSGGTSDILASTDGMSDIPASSILPVPPTVVGSVPPVVNAGGAKGRLRTITYSVPLQTTSRFRQYARVEIPFLPRRPNVPFLPPGVAPQYRPAPNVVQVYHTQTRIAPVCETTSNTQHGEMPSNVAPQAQTSNELGFRQVTAQTSATAASVTFPRTSERLFCKILPRPSLPLVPPPTSTAETKKRSRQSEPVKIMSTPNEPMLQCFRCFKKFLSNKCLLQHLKSHFS